jgi:hypothetical protein
MSSLAIVRAIVKNLMQADADDEELHKKKPEMRKVNILKNTKSSG